MLLVRLLVGFLRRGSMSEFDGGSLGVLGAERGGKPASVVREVIVANARELRAVSGHHFINNKVIGLQVVLTDCTNFVPPVGLTSSLEVDLHASHLHPPCSRLQSRR